MEPAFWHWLILGLVLMAVELAAPGFVFFWLGVSAVVTGIVVLAAGAMAWQWQIVIFALATVGSVAGWLAWRRQQPANLTPTLNRGAGALIGRVGRLERGTGAGNGRIRLGDTTWPATGEAMPDGSLARVIGHEGSLLRVEPAAEPHRPGPDAAG